MTQPYDARRKQISKTPVIRTDAASTAGAVFGVALALSVSALMIMGVVKVGLIWFG